MAERLPGEIWPLSAASTKYLLAHEPAGADWGPVGELNRTVDVYPEVVGELLARGDLRLGEGEHEHAPPGSRPVTVADTLSAGAPLPLARAHKYLRREKPGPLAKVAKDARPLFVGASGEAAHKEMLDDLAGRDLVEVRKAQPWRARLKAARRTPTGEQWVAAYHEREHALRDQLPDADLGTGTALVNRAGSIVLVTADAGEALARFAQRHRSSPGWGQAQVGELGGLLAMGAIAGSLASADMLGGLLEGASGAGGSLFDLLDGL